MMMELELDYLNKIAHQLIVVSSLLSGFSIAVLANMLVSKNNDRLSNTILIVTTIAAASFLVTVFSMTNLVMLTTEGYPFEVSNDRLNLPKVTGFFAFFLGLITLSLLIGLSGWTKSRRTGIITSSIGFLTFLMILMNM